MNTSIFKDICYQPYMSNKIRLFRNAKDNLQFIQRFGLLRKLPVHDGCVNTLQWNSTGEYILSGSDDQHLVITHGHNYKVLVDYTTSHRANIFSAKFLPCCCDRQIVSCSGDGVILHTDLQRSKETYNNQFNCHSGTTYEVITIYNDPNTFLSCGEDGSVRWFDLRTKTSCKKEYCKEDVLIKIKCAVTALAINPLASHQLAVGCSDSTVRIYDRRCLSTQGAGLSGARPFCTFIAPDLEDRPYRITSLSYSSDGQDMLVSYSCDHLYLFGIVEDHCTELKKYSKGRLNWNKLRNLAGKRDHRSPPPVRRLRLRGDWSDTGPDARPERESSSSVTGIISQARPQLQGTLMQRMTDVLSRMLNDPLTRAALHATTGDEPLGQEPAQPMESDNRSQTESNEMSDIVIVNAPDESSPQPVAISTEVNTEQNPSTSSETVTVTTTEISNDDEAMEEDETDAEKTASVNSTNSEQSTTSNQTSHSVDPSTINTAIITRHLRNRLSVLRSLRQGFIEQHGAEPSVSLRYFEQSTSNSTISLSADNLVNHEDFDATPSGTSSHKDKELGYADKNTNLLDGSRQPKIHLSLPFSMIDDFWVAYCRQNDVDLDFDETDESEEPCSSLYDAQVKMKYTGHRNARTMIKEATFWGNNYVMSGSDCGHVFIWDRKTANLKMLLQADNHVVNCLQPHPSLPILATSGIDHDIKLWAPTLEEPSFNVEVAKGLIQRNEIMLEETRDTITVPAAFMIRMLACLNQIRNVGHFRMRNRDDDQSNS